MAGKDSKPQPKAAAKGPVKKKSYMIYKVYEKSGNTIKSKNRTCPKCGPGVLMGNHKNRHTCGKCGFMEKK